eukprot:SAG11_NODE_15279_length_583_cov_0.991736_1_plen_29_part_10
MALLGIADLNVWAPPAGQRERRLLPVFFW